MFFKQFRSKFSQFEKPYLEDEYPQMHLEFPGYDWGTWKPWELPPTGPFPSLPGYKPGRNSFSILPDDQDRRCDQGGCLVIDWPPYYVEPGELYKLYISTNAYPVIDVAVSGPITFTSDCIGKVLPSGSSLCGVYCGGWMQIDDGADDGESISVTFITAEGGSCCYTGEVEAGCDPNADIEYTTLQMDFNEQQSLGVSLSGEDYTWAISSGGGSLDESSGSQVTYTAPSSNSQCNSNPTIVLSCDGAQIDSITIAITNPAMENDGAYWFTGACYICATQWCVNKTGRSCTDKTLSSGAWCSRATEALCIANCDPNNFVDTRTESQLNAGCCPEGLL